MAANQRIIPQENPFQGIDDIMYVIQNPKEYKKAQETIREQMQLNAEEQVKADEARNFIKKYDKLKADIDADKKTSEEGLEALKKAREGFEVYKEKEEARLTALADAFAQKELETAEEKRKALAAQDSYEKLEKQLNKKSDERSKELDDREVAITEKNNQIELLLIQAKEDAAKVKAKLALFKD